VPDIVFIPEDAIVANALRALCVYRVCVATTTNNDICPDSEQRMAIRSGHEWFQVGMKGTDPEYTRTDALVEAVEQQPSLAAAWVVLGHEFASDALSSFTVKGEHFTAKEAYETALGHDDQVAMAWNGLGAVGGGSVRGRRFCGTFSAKHCFEHALWIDSHYRSAWCNLAKVGGGIVGHELVTGRDCCQKALAIDPSRPREWRVLGALGGGVVGAREYTAGKCYEEALALDGSDAEAFNGLGAEGGGVLRAWPTTPALPLPVGYLTDLSEADCYLRALAVDPFLANAWTNLGFIGGGKVGGTAYTKKACYRRALELDPKSCANAWNNLGSAGGDVAFSKKRCFVEAVKINPEHRNAWVNLAFLGGDVVNGVRYDKAACLAASRGVCVGVSKRDAKGFRTAMAGSFRDTPCRGS